MEKEIIPEETISSKIFIIRGHKVMFDVDLAKLYDVATKVLNQAVKRNLDRFPEDFAFQLSVEEYANLRSQFVTSSLEHGGRRYLPYVFTEHGVSMLSAVLKSEQAVHMSIFIIRAFIKMRELLSANKDLAYKIDEIERKQKEHGEQLSSVYSIVKQLIAKPVKPKGKIGFSTETAE